MTRIVTFDRAGGQRDIGVNADRVGVTWTHSFKERGSTGLVAIEMDYLNSDGDALEVIYVAGELEEVNAKLDGKEPAGAFAQLAEGFLSGSSDMYYSKRKTDSVSAEPTFRRRGKTYENLELEYLRTLAKLDAVSQMQDRNDKLFVELQQDYRRLAMAVAGDKAKDMTCGDLVSELAEHRDKLKRVSWNEAIRCVATELRRRGHQILAEMVEGMKKDSEQGA